MRPGVTGSCSSVREQEGSKQGFGMEMTEKKTGVLGSRRQKVRLTVDQLLKELEVIVRQHGVRMEGPIAELEGY